MGKVLALIGIFIVLAGLILMGLEWLIGKRGLPGDIHFQRDGVTIHFPIVTMLLLSLILTVILNLIFWLFSRR